MNVYLDLVAQIENDNHVEVAMALHKKFVDEIKNLIDEYISYIADDFHILKEGKCSLNVARKIISGLNVFDVVNELRDWIAEECTNFSVALSELADKAGTNDHMELDIALNSFFANQLISA